MTAGVLDRVRVLDPDCRDLCTLDDRCRAAATEIRQVSAVIDRCPDAIRNFLRLDAVAVARVGRRSCRARVIIQERLGYGDPGFFLACPGPALSGVAVAALADPAVARAYFARFDAEPTWSFFALTEPRKGSAAMELETMLTPDGDGWLLNGEKCYVGNGARSRYGVVFCRRAPGPWGIEAVWVDTADPGFSAELLPTVGLRGARISRMRFDGMPVSPDRLLGHGRPAGRRGLYGAQRTLLRFRPALAALSIGVAAAVCDYVLEFRRTDRFDALILRIHAVRRQIHQIADEFDHGTVRASRIAAVKLRAVRLAEETVQTAADLLGPTALLDHPWLEKTCRDVRALEFMEGTADIHRLAVFQGLIRDEYFGEGQS